MDASSEHGVFEVSRERISAITTQQRHPMRSLVVFMCSGFIVGLSFGQSITLRLKPGTAQPIIESLVFAIAGLQIYLMVRDWLDMRKMHKELEEQREEMLKITKAELTKLFPNDPIHVAKVMLRLQEGLFKLL